MRIETSDNDLASAAASGDGEAFASLLSRHYDSLFRLAFRLTGSRAEAEDLTQDVCLSLAVKIQGFRAEARFSTWLFRVAVNAAHDRRRRQVSSARAADAWGDWELERRAADADTADQLGWLMNAMTALPDALRDTLALVLDGDMTHAEVGNVLGIPEGTVSWRVSEARKCLRELRRQEQFT